MANLGIESEWRSKITALPSSTETITTGAVAFALQFGRGPLWVKPVWKRRYKPVVPSHGRYCHLDTPYYILDG